MNDVTRTKDELFRERSIISVPSLSATLRSLEPGDYVHCGTNWSYATIRQTASNHGVSIQTKRTSKGITVLRPFDFPEEL
jgi:hypothetical protein